MDKSINMVITGASRGLGASISKIAASMGGKVFLTARNEEKLKNVANEINAQGGNAKWLAGDLTDFEFCKQLRKNILTAFGKIDVLINNAGTVKPIASFSETNFEDWERNLQLNLISPARLTHLFIPEIRKQEGRVISITSGSATQAVKGSSPYSTAKAGLNQFNRSLAVEEPKITSLIVSPGMMDTDMQRDVRDQGITVLPKEIYQQLVGFHQNNILLNPDLPGRAIALIALHAPLEWSGEIILWDDPRISEFETLTN